MPSPITASSSIDVQGMVSNLMSFERRPLTQMQTEAKKIDTKISAYGKLQSQVAAFRDAAATLSRLETWRSVKGASADASAVEVTASAGAGASQHMVAVQQLAQSQTVSSGSYASSAAVVGGGTVRIQLGTQPTGPNSFTPDGARPEIAVAVAAGATLADVRDAINAADAGVRASIVRDGDQVRLFVTGTESGGNQAFRMQVDDADGGSTDAAGLSAIAFDPVAAVGAGKNLSLVRQAVDSEYTIDGVALTGRSNRISGAMDGIDLVLKKVTAAEVQVDVTVDAEALKASTQKFVDAYNGLNKLLAEQTRYDDATKTAGALQGDRTAVSILGQVRNVVRETVSGGTLSKLADVGITLQRDGSLSLSSSGFDSATVDPSKLEKLFAAPGTGGSVTAPDRGLMLRFKTLGDSLLASDGSVQTATDSWAARLKANKTRQAAFEVRMTDVEKRLLRQYSSLDAQLAAAQQSSAALASALGALPKT
ncbi:MAG: flagellar hook protein [Burkholderiales bacterium]|nr:MAG: flagellar hook protein [Burkholderiales bacterium]